MKKLVLIITCWIILIGAGTFYLMQYNSKAGDDFSEAKAFPEMSRLKLDPQRFTLVFFAHPQCPCTRASLRELDRLIAKNRDEIRTYIVLVKPSGASDEWLNGDIKDSAANIPGATVVTDNQEIETRLFNAQTSGVTLLYDQKGTLLFHGGITVSRGMEGDNQGAGIINALVKGESVAGDSAPVFGCVLQDRKIN